MSSPFAQAYQREREPAFGAQVSDAIFTVHRYGRGVLLLMNGAPGVGTSTLGRLHSRVHPLSLVIDIDAIRMQLGGWEEHTESRQIARDLAVLGHEVGDGLT